MAPPVPAPPRRWSRIERRTEPGCGTSDNPSIPECASWRRGREPVVVVCPTAMTDEHPPKGILFLCVANSARSQMAEGLARRLARATGGRLQRRVGAGIGEPPRRPRAARNLRETPHGTR
ncbi:MAG: hypothetical protein ACREK3_08785 [Gemmatimonadota bacterium]